MSPAYFRGELAERRVHRYQAVAVSVNRRRFSLMLNERIPLALDVALRLETYLQHFDEEEGRL